MKSESEIKEQIKVYNDVLMRSESMEDIRRNQGILFALHWMVTEDEKKEGESNESDE